MKFAKRTDWPADENALAKLSARKKESGVPVIDLTESNPTRCGFAYLNSGLLKSFSAADNLRYEPDPHGLLSAREAVCRYYREKKITVSPEQIFLTAGTSEAYSFLFRLLVDPEKTVLAPSPGYPLFDTLADLNDVRLVHYSLGEELPLAADFRALITVNPNNPTGCFVSPEEKKQIDAFCRDHQAAVIADEVFLDFALEGTAPVSFAAGGEALTFTLSGISKILGLPQMKLSWIVVSGPETVRRNAISRLEIIADTYLSVNTPSQNALAAWFGDSRPREEIVARCRSNLRYLKERLNQSDVFRVLPVAGGWYATLEIQNGKTDEELALDLLGKENTLVHPGYFFDFQKENFLVLSLLPPTEVFKKGIERLHSCLCG